MNFVFRLTEPSVPENVNTAAVALKTIWFSKMGTVNPGVFMDKKALRSACCLQDILVKATCYDKIDDPVGNINFLMAKAQKTGRNF